MAIRNCILYLFYGQITLCLQLPTFVKNLDKFVLLLSFYVSLLLKHKNMKKKKYEKFCKNEKHSTKTVIQPKLRTFNQS